MQPAQRRPSSSMNSVVVMCGMTIHCMALRGTGAFLVVYGLRPLQGEAIAAKGRALGNHS